MAATLLVTDPKWTWRDWLKSNLVGRDYICLDVADADNGPPARAFLLQQGRIRAFRFVGSVYANRNPVDLVVAAQQLLAHARDPVIALFEMRESPVLRQMALALAEAIDPDRILAPEGSPFLLEPWPVPAEAVDLQESLPLAAVLAHRRSRWLDMLENGSEHRVELDRVGLYGVRLGSGRRLRGAPFDALGIHVEAYGQSLLIVTDQDLDESVIGDAMNHAHASRLHLVAPDAYDGLVCSFVRGTGEDFGMGVVRSIDWEKRELTVLNTAVAPAPVRVLRIGSTRIDETGKETGEVKPWAV
jgi:polynucleotide 5'-kinase involved in rRNA processing